jgi:hypothetical protein
MFSIRNCSAWRFLWFVMAVHIFNCSVDNPDQFPNSVPEDLSFNEMESVLEIILEQLCGIEDAISEYDENDAEEKSTTDSFKKLVKFCSRPSSAVYTFHPSPVSTLQIGEYSEGFYLQHKPVPVAPPPKA